MKTIKMDFDPHTHSKYSDGKGTLEENILSAINKGLKKIALTDHAYLHMAFGVKMNKIDKYLKDAYELKKSFNSQIEVLVGMEFNLLGLDGTVDIPKGYEDEFELKLIGDHKFAKYKDIKSFMFMIGFQLSEKKRYSKDVLKANTNAYISAIENNNIDIIAHPSNMVKLDIKTLAKVCEKTDTLLEINSRHPDLKPMDVKEILATKADFILGSDSHKSSDIGECEYGEKFILENKIPLKRVVNAVNA
jgi:putative hydrolase